MLRNSENNVKFEIGNVYDFKYSLGIIEIVNFNTVFLVLQALNSLFRSKNAVRGSKITGFSKNIFSSTTIRLQSFHFLNYGLHEAFPSAGHGR